jgi:hypothetical protein
MLIYITSNLEIRRISGNSKLACKKFAVDLHGGENRG